MQVGKGTILSLFLFIERGVAWLPAVILVVCLLFGIALKRLLFQQFLSFKCSFFLCICGLIGQTTAEKQTAWSYFGERFFLVPSRDHRKPAKLYRIPVSIGLFFVNATFLFPRSWCLSDRLPLKKRAILW